MSTDTAFARILCPLNLRRESEDALGYAVRLASAFGSRLIVIHCVETDSTPGHADEGIRARLRQAVQRSMTAGSTSPANWEYVVVYGHPANLIPKEASRRHADLIVMSATPRPPSSPLLGSTAESICRTSPCPVLVSRASAALSPAGYEKPGLKKILVAYDFSDYAELALANACALAQEFGAELHLVHVLPVAPRRETGDKGIAVGTSETAFQRAAAALEQAAPGSPQPLAAPDRGLRHAHPRQRPPGLKIAVREGQPYREILDYAEEEAIDLICMGVWGSGFGLRSLFGSNSDRVLRQAPCPVMISRPLKPATAQIAGGLGG